MSIGKASWVDEEPSRRDDWRELTRLVHRATRSPLRIIGLALLLTAIAIGWRAQKIQTFSSRVVLRVTEGAIEAETAPPPNRQLKAYVQDVIFSNARLRKVIVAHGLYPDRWAQDPDGVVDSFRGGIKVEVWRNYFLLGWEAGDPVRSARIAVSYASKDPQLSLAIAQDLGNLIVTESEAERVAQSERARRTVEQNIASVRQELERLSLQAARLELVKPRTPARTLELFDLRQSIQHLESELMDRSQFEASLQFRSVLERNRQGLDFQLVDPGHLAANSRSQPVELGVTAAFLFALLLPLMAIFVGSFDGRVHRLEDVERLGLRPLGHVRSLPGEHEAGVSK